MGLKKGAQLQSWAPHHSIPDRNTAIQACTMKNMAKGYKVETSIFSLIIKVAIKVLNSFQINSKLVWECHQSLVKLSEHNRVQLILVPGHTGIDSNETADQLARKGSPYPLIGPEPALGISAKVVKGLVRDWKHEEIWLSMHE
jgi:hypothetical protein